MEDVDFSELKEQDRQLRRTIKSIATFVSEFQRGQHEIEVEVRLETLENAMRKFYEVQRRMKVILDDEEIERKPDTKETETERKRRIKTHASRREAEFDETANEVEKFYYPTKAALLNLRPNGKNTMEPKEGSDTTMSRVKLPDIQLPSFGGKLREWVTFRDMFVSLINNNSQLSPIDKFSYLRSSVTDEALQEISSIEMTAANFQVAWNALEKRYENRKLIVKAHLDALFAIEPMRRENCESLNRLISDFDKNLQMLSKIGEQPENWSTLLAHMVCMRLDAVTLRQWETHHNSKEVPKYEKVMDFLRDQCLVLQSLLSNNAPESEFRRSKITTTHLSSQLRGSCVFCGEPFHKVYQCRRFQHWSVNERLSEVRKHRLCINCLSTEHFVDSCLKDSCQLCRDKHHILLHFDKPSNFARPYSSSVPQRRRRPSYANQPRVNQSRPNSQYQPQHPPNQAPPPASTSYPVVQSSNPQPNPQVATDTLISHTFGTTQRSESFPLQVLLSTAVVRVVDRFGNHTFARTLLDSCSEFCYITSSFAKKLNLHEVAETLKVQGIGNASVTSTKAVEAIIEPRLPTLSNYRENMRFHILPNITRTLPVKPVPIHHVNLLPDVVLADPEFWKPVPIDMIIGAEYFYELLCDESQKIADAGPVLQNSVFGWIVSGKVSEKQSDVFVSLEGPDQCGSGAPRMCQSSTATFVSSTAQLEELVARFWELESCHSKSTFSVEETTCEEYFKRTTIRDSNGRFIVSLPKRPAIIRQLGESRKTALRRFISLEKRLIANPELNSMYTEFIHEYLLMGHMREVLGSQSSGQILGQSLVQGTRQNLEGQNHDSVVYYMPHHAVLKPDSTTTKLRVVFDASCRTSTGVSLNDGLMVGPVVQNDLMSIILRFRLHRYAISADVEKMYRMVRVQSPDQHLQRILWRDSPNDPVKAYELTTVTYGTASAPYLATRCLKKLGEDNITTHPIGSRVIIEDFYVDDCLTGADSIQEARALIQETTSLTDSAGFNLRKFNTNCSRILKGLPRFMIDNQSVFELDSSSSTVKTLGMKWDTRADEFCFSYPQLRFEKCEITKRVVHSDVACLFDPLGLVGPVVVQAKIFIQHLWRIKLDWDDPLDEYCQQFWKEYRENLVALAQLSIPRWALNIDDLSRPVTHPDLQSNPLKVVYHIKQQPARHEDFASINNDPTHPPEH
ncbi:uncharacterized protein LOC129743554 [Uranotaenia lowii]|uniref:uncharacterized protein LOC129743554 n=1 Tax=Uranotaenia lowii TaxID=190385 RepID=UPI00247A26FE|nr:uncharacterized protein LOC129743554 [Uranotaenia lowii]